MAGSGLDAFLPNVQTQDTRKRVQVHPELVAFLKDPESSLYCEEMDRIIDGLAQWIGSSNFKVGQLLFSKISSLVFTVFRLRLIIYILATS